MKQTDLQADTKLLSAQYKNPAAASSEVCVCIRLPLFPAHSVSGQVLRNHHDWGAGKVPVSMIEWNLSESVNQILTGNVHQLNVISQRFHHLDKSLVQKSVFLFDNAVDILRSCSDFASQPFLCVAAFQQFDLNVDFNIVLNHLSLLAIIYL